MYKQQKITNQVSSVSSSLDFVHVVCVVRQVFWASTALLGHVIPGHMFPVRSSGGLEVVVGGGALVPVAPAFPRRLLVLLTAAAECFGAGRRYGAVRERNASGAQHVFLPAVRRTGRGCVHRDGWLRVPGEIRGGARWIRRRRQGGAGVTLAAVDGAVKHVLQLTVVHHVIHGRLHLQEHPLLLPLRDASETHSWKRDSLHLVLLLWTTFLQKNVVVQVLKSTSQKLDKEDGYGIYGYCNSPSRDIPTDEHFLKRHCWQRLRFIRTIVQLSVFRHFLYWIFCWMLLLKKPCKKH